MKVYEIDNEYVKSYEKLTPSETIEELQKDLKYEYEGSEKDFEENIIENIGSIIACLGLPDVTNVVRQKLINVIDFNIKPDIILEHKDGSRTVIEIKHRNKRYPNTGTFNQIQSIGQVLLYKQILSAYYNCKVRCAVIDNKIYYRTYLAFLENKLPITLIDYQFDRVFIPYNAWSDDYEK